jgi:hypothetical protein
MYAPWHSSLRPLDRGMVSQLVYEVVRLTQPECVRQGVALHVKA